MLRKGIVACSGGPDSMALLDTLRKQGVFVEVCHVNYKKRESAKRDENIVRAYCKRYDIPLFVLYPKFGGVGNFQAWAREVRYAFFVETAKKEKITDVYLAHHLDDHIETYLFQIQNNRLGNRYGLKSRVPFKGVTLVRPFLNQTKADLLRYCQEHGVAYGIDESNLTDAYSRNIIRHSIVEKMNLDEKRKWQKEIQEANKEYTAKKEEIHSLLEGFDGQVERISNWFVLEEWLYEKTGKRFSCKMCKDVLKQVQSDCLIDLKEYELESFKGTLYLQKKTEPVLVQVENVNPLKHDCFELKKSGRTIEGMTLSESDFPLTIRNVLPGDFIELRYGKKKLHRFFIDRKIPRITRKRWLVVANSQGKVIFVPEIGCDVQHFSVKPNLFMVQCTAYLREK